MVNDKKQLVVPLHAIRPNEYVQKYKGKRRSLLQGNHATTTVHVHYNTTTE
jgi:hypothetical protein